MTTPTGYVVTFVHRESVLGAGVLLNRRFAVTALHCLKRLPSGVRRIDVQVGSVRVPGRIEEVARAVDLALIRITVPLDDSGVSIPLAGLCRANDSWFAPYRPNNADPYLDGDVVAESIPYTCVPGGTLDAIQLECRQHLGDYSGYSGGPVERRFEEHAELVGILIEQYPDRQMPGRATNTLFAAPVREAVRRFESLHVAHLAAALGIGTQPLGSEVVRPSNFDSGSSPDGVDQMGRTRNALAIAELKLRAIRQWAADGLLEPDEVPALRLRVARDILWAEGEVERSGR